MIAVEDYLALIAAQHRTKPKFSTTVAALCQPLVTLQNTILALPQSFDLDAGVGNQLDILGKWIGLTRFLPTPITGVYFAWDTDGLGWDYGIWQGPFDPDEGLTRLDDETFRTLLKIKVAANHWDGTIPGAVAILNALFSTTPGVKLFIQDNQDMTMLIGLAGLLPSILFLELLVHNFFPLKPEGVAFSYLFTSRTGHPIFGFDVESDYYISGWDVGYWGVSEIRLIIFSVENPFDVTVLDGGDSTTTIRDLHLESGPAIEAPWVIEYTGGDSVAD